MTRVLGIDYGKRRIGIAVSDPMRILACRLTTIVRKDNATDAAVREVAELCAAHGVDTVIIGHPLRTDGRFSEIAEEAERFAEAVREAVPCRVELFDERFTSVLASRVIRESVVQKKREKGLVDRVAAEILLQDWLDRERLNA